MPPPGFATAPNPVLGTRERLYQGVCNSSLQGLPWSRIEYIIFFGSQGKKQVL